MHSGWQEGLGRGLNIWRQQDTLVSEVNAAVWLIAMLLTPCCST
jgi:hypothetical protein